MILNEESCGTIGRTSNPETMKEFINLVLFATFGLIALFLTASYAQRS